MDPSYDLWCVVFVHNTLGLVQTRLSFEPEAEKTCEDLIAEALRIDPNNAEALQMLASVRMSQQRPDDAKDCLEKSWTSWKDLDIGMLKYIQELAFLTDTTQMIPKYHRSQHVWHWSNSSLSFPCILLHCWYYMASCLQTIKKSRRGIWRVGVISSWPSKPRRMVVRWMI